MQSVTVKTWVLACLLYSLAMVQTQAAPNNFIDNPGAESGLSSWSTFGGGPALQLSGVAHTGAQSFLLGGRTQFYHGPSYDIKPLIDGGQLIPGQRYQVSVWVRHMDANAQTLYLNVKKVDGSGTDYHTIEKRTAPTGVWTEISGFYVPEIHGALSNLTLYVVSSNGATFDFYSDDFFLGEVEDYDPPMSSNAHDFVRASGRNLVVGADNEVILFNGLNVTVPVDASDGAEDVWNTKAISARDFQNIRSIGFNAVRLHMNYKSFEDDDVPGVFKADGWRWLDRAVALAKEAGLYLMLDMHGPQGGYQSDKTPGFPAFWDGSGDVPNTANQDRLIALWRAIAARYQHEPAILGYDLINEPRPHHSEEWYAYAEQIIAAIRQVDSQHLIVVEVPLISNYTIRLVNDANVMYDSHFYSPWAYATQYSTHYGNAGERWGQYDSPDNPLGSSFNKHYLRDYFQGDILDFTIANNVPTDVGEYGVVHEAFPQDVNALGWIDDIHAILDGDNHGGMRASRFYFSYQGGPFGIYPNWSGFHAQDIAANQPLKDYWINYLADDSTPPDPTPDPESDTVAPVISLLGGNPVNLIEGDDYIEAGAIASDDVDGDLTSQILVTGSVDTGAVGRYAIRYNVTDAAGNAANEVTRTINVAAIEPPPTEAQADLRIRFRKTYPSGDLEIGRAVGYEVITDNDGGDTAVGTVLTLTVPAGTTWQSGSAGCALSGNQVICDLGDIGNDQQRTRNIYVNAMQAGDFTVTAASTSTTADPNLTNHQASITLQVMGDETEGSEEPPVNGDNADLRLTLRKTYPSAPTLGRAVGYEVKTFNDGPDGAANTVTRLAVPTGTEWVSGSRGCAMEGSEVVCVLGDIPNGSRRTRNIYVRPVNAGDFIATASTDSDVTDRHAANNQVSLSINIQ